MSAFLLNPERIAQLADYISTLYNNGFNFFGYDMPQDLKNQIIENDCCDIYGNATTKKIFKLLYSLNAAAVAGRYKCNPETAPDLPKFNPIHHTREQGTDETIRAWYEEIKPWHYELFKLTQCFLYQCDEDATCHTGLFKALKELESIQALHIVQNNPLWQRATWG
jgi:hypothetical protein